MKKLFLIMAMVMISAITFTGCAPIDYDNSPELKGKSFRYWNGYTGSMYTSLTYHFEKNGSVSRSGLVGSISMDVDHLKYTLDGDVIIIYHDNSTYWKKSVRNTVYISGNYYGTYMMFDGDKYELE